MSRKIDVNKQEIMEAVTGDSDRCAIADAIRRCIPGAVRVQVDVRSIRFTNRRTGKRYIYFTPPIAQKHLLAFDRGQRKKMRPFVVYLDDSRSVVVPCKPMPNAAKKRLAKVTKASGRKKGGVKVTRQGVRVPRAYPGSRDRFFGLHTIAEGNP